MLLSKTIYPLLSTGSAQDDPSQLDRKNVHCDVKNQNKYPNILNAKQKICAFKAVHEFLKLNGIGM